MQKPKVIAIVGPTSSGKTALSIHLAHKLHGEIISADSRQVYKGLNIGTGKVTKKEMKRVPHHLLNIASPKKQFSVDDFVRLASKKISEVYGRKKVPLVVGGTGLYADMLLGRMSYPNVPPDIILRAQLEKKTTKQLFVQLQKLDSRRATTIEPQHKRRLIRAIEIARVLGKNPLSKPEQKYKVLWLGLNSTEAKLKNKIRTRLRVRLKAGMVAEVQALHARDLTYKRMEELGLEYKYLSLYLQKKMTKQELEAQLERAIVNYAKRQIRWFKRNNDIVWIQTKNEALRLSKNFLS